MYKCIVALERSVRGMFEKVYRRLRSVEFKMTNCSRAVNNLTSTILSQSIKVIPVSPMVGESSNQGVRSDRLTEIGRPIRKALRLI